MAYNFTYIIIVQTLVEVFQLALSTPFFLNSIGLTLFSYNSYGFCLFSEEAGYFYCLDLHNEEIYVSPELVEDGFQDLSIATLQQLSMLVKTTTRLAQKTQLWVKVCQVSHHVKHTPGEVDLLPSGSFYIENILFWYSSALDKYFRVDYDSFQIYGLQDPSDDMATWQHPSEQELENVVDEISDHYIYCHTKILNHVTHLYTYLQTKDLVNKFSAS